MTVQINTLRVEMDSSNFEAGAKKVEAAAKGAATAGQSMTAAVVKLTDTVVGSGSKISQAGDAAERLRRQFIPGAGDAARLESAVRALNGQLEIGKLTATEFQMAMDGAIRRFGTDASAAVLAARGQGELAAAISRTTNAITAQGNALKAANQNMTAFRANAAEARNFNAANVGYQFQDIAVTSAMGMSPMMIALQQGSQLTSALGSAGAAGAVRTLAAAFGSLVSPVSLVTMGLVAAAAAAIQYGSSLFSSSEKSEESLEKQRQIIDQIAKSWGDAAPALNAYAAEQERLRKMQDTSEAFTAAASDKWAPLRDSIGDIVVGMADLRDKAQGFGESASQIVERLRVNFNQLEAGIDNGNATASQAQTIYSDLLKLYAQTSQTEIKTFAADFTSLAAEIDKAAAAAGRLNSEGQKLSALQSLSILPGASQRGPMVMDAEQMAGVNDAYNAQAAAQQAAERARREAEAIAAGKGIPIPETRPTSPYPMIDSETTATRPGTLMQDNTGARSNIVEQIQARQQLFQTQQLQIEQLQLEAELVGKSAQERATMTAALQAEQELRQSGIRLTEQETAGYVANAQARALARVEIDRQNAAFASMQQTGTAALSSLITGTGTFKERLKGMIDQTLTWVQTMTLVNPISNAAYGESFSLDLPSEAIQ